MEPGTDAAGELIRPQLGNFRAPGGNGQGVSRASSELADVLSRLGFTAFENLLADFLGRRFDLLHFFANPRSGSLIATMRFVHIVFRFLHQPL
jgi:hypothetical protein